MIHRAKDFRKRLHQWLENGLPDDFIGDAAADKKATDVVKVLGSLDKKVLQKISSKSRKLLIDACGKIEKSLRFMEYGDNDDV
jgi:hypothetical protein